MRHLLASLLRRVADRIDPPGPASPADLHRAAADAFMRAALSIGRREYARRVRADEVN